MMRVRAAVEPPHFNEVVRKPGVRALKELVGDPTAGKRTGRKRTVKASKVEDLKSKDYPDYWTQILKDLRSAYGHTCAYLGVRIENYELATVDHFKPKTKHPNLAYEWHNYRLALHQINRIKDVHEDVLDPFDVEDGWFEMNRLTGELAPAESLDPELRARVKSTIKRLRLNDVDYCATRMKYHDGYLNLNLDNTEPSFNFAAVRLEFPFVALELKRQRLLRSEDHAPCHSWRS